MYRIIGGDGQEYGPVSAGEVRQWLTEGRLNAQSRIRPEGATDWTTVGALPEFAASVGPAPMMTGSVVPPTSAPGGREAALAGVKGPAIGMIVSCALGMAFTLMGRVMNFARGPQDLSQLPPELARLVRSLEGPAGIAMELLSLAMGALVIVGAIRMMQLRQHGLAFAAAILVMIPCLSPCCLLGIPFGIWALVVLNKPEVKSHFG